MSSAWWTWARKLLFSGSAEPAAPLFEVGMLVEMHSLCSSALWLNGQCGVVVAFSATDGRFVVRRVSSGSSSSSSGGGGNDDDDDGGGNDDDDDDDDRKKTDEKQQDQQQDDNDEDFDEKDFFRLKPENLRLSPGTSRHEDSDVLGLRLEKLLAARCLAQACAAVVAAGGRLDFSESMASGSSSSSPSLQAALGIVSDADRRFLERAIIAGD